MLAFIGSPQDIGVILLVALVLFGGKRLPELARSLGQGVREFRRSIQGIGEPADGDEPDHVSGPKSS